MLRMNRPLIISSDYTRLYRQELISTDPKFDFDENNEKEANVEGLAFSLKVTSTEGALEDTTSRLVTSKSSITLLKVWPRWFLRRALIFRATDD